MEQNKVVRNNINKNERMTKGNVYIMVNTDTRNIKIGKSANVDERLKSLNGAYKMLGEKPRIELLYSVRCEDDLKLERHLHRHFKDFNVQNEWFSINPKNVIDYIETLDMNDFCKKEEKNFDFSNGIKYIIEDIKYEISILEFKSYKQQLYVTPYYIIAFYEKYFRKSNLLSNILSLKKCLDNMNYYNRDIFYIIRNNEFYISCYFCVLYMKIFINKEMVKESFIEKICSEIIEDFKEEIIKVNYYNEIDTLIEVNLDGYPIEEYKRAETILLQLLGDYYTFQEVPIDKFKSADLESLVCNICENIKLSCKL
ncbi:GIY-YIG nuclease family protein [Clostridium beijerinckii]|uniref:GIY-YIG nuclease family protein n=1 Tax=Clostridium beijerinckii TaxID=1520 RepID=UPI00156DD302|nr:GIY-YIG nuclease family protein [Clostridium beijerinckii]NRU52566.1 hypothetical protein [Clostridium beijerinckii]NYC69257.1 hypothetical protein [Clostridium beijerinckii]NYC91767.1 hypothetical protein [Clostridium beijerinckii]